MGPAILFSSFNHSMKQPPLARDSLYISSPNEPRSFLRTQSPISPSFPPILTTCFRAMQYPPKSQMNFLPPELLELILLWTVRACPYDKNKVLALRTVSKAFNTALRPYVLKTIQLEFSRFLKRPESLGGGPPDERALEAIGGFCQALCLDMMAVRDEGTYICQSK